MAKKIIKVMRIYTNHQRQEVEFSGSGDMEVMMYEEKKCIVDCRGKFFDFGWLMWPHYEFENKVRYMTGKLMELGFYAHNVNEGHCYGQGQVITYKPCAEMAELYKRFKHLYNLKADGFPRLNFYGIKASIIKAGTFKFEVQFIGGHYVAGSYTHDYTAAASYLKVLNKHMGNMQFEWKRYDSSNGHSYFFETTYTIGKTKFKSDGKIKQKVKG